MRAVNIGNRDDSLNAFEVPVFYSRCRHDWPEGDRGRSELQRNQETSHG